MKLRFRGNFPHFLAYIDLLNVKQVAKRMVDYERDE
jgi:hypothetical protein